MSLVARQPANDSVRRVLGALVGGAVGAAAYWAALQRSIHRLAAIGALLAVGAGWAATRQCRKWGFAIGASAPVITVLVGWQLFPGAREAGLWQFLSGLSTNSIVSLVVVAGLGVWLGCGRDRKGPSAA